MTLNILGTDYTVKKVMFGSDPIFGRRGLAGYCDSLTKMIVICDMNTYPTWENEDEVTKREGEKAALRHEIVHAFLHESGLNNSAHDADGWAQDEEIVEWIALQGPKLYKAWQEIGAL